MKVNFIMKITILLLLLISLSACSDKLEKENDDGTLTRISYKNHFFLSRTPLFVRTDHSITMKFNDREWYVASPIQESEAKRIAQGELIAKNNNIEAYKNISKNDFAYIYVLKLEGSDKTYIAISSNDDQDGQGYGLDFNYFIEFSLDGRVTIPDMNFEME